jgi:hypothetical protein
MNIKILTPEFVVFEGEVDSVLLPGKNGDLNHHFFREEEQNLLRLQKLQIPELIF